MDADFVLQERFLVISLEAGIVQCRPQQFSVAHSESFGQSLRSPEGVGFVQGGLDPVVAFKHAGVPLLSSSFSADIFDNGTGNVYILRPGSKGKGSLSDETFPPAPSGNLFEDEECLG